MTLPREQKPTPPPATHYDEYNLAWLWHQNPAEALRIATERGARKT